MFGRFLLSGGFNTLVTYLLYLLLLVFFSYQISYTISYCLGVVLAYCLNRVVVFKSHRGLRSLLLFPLVYVVQYLLTSGVLWVLVVRLGVDDRIALLVAIVLMVPVNFLLSKNIFTRKI
ncbi:GtrA family protein [Pseudomonas sp. SIMBA_041]|uniref:GtrA family protein n=1 Tax=Pseudomonas TaxID=286 RepID=UPI002B4B3BF9|nr:GtrA family protein [Pseudomonas mucoides]